MPEPDPLIPTPATHRVAAVWPIEPVYAQAGVIKARADFRFVMSSPPLCWHLNRVGWTYVPQCEELARACQQIAAWSRALRAVNAGPPPAIWTGVILHPTEQNHYYLARLIVRRKDDDHVLTGQPASLHVTHARTRLLDGRE